MEKIIDWDSINCGPIKMVMAILKEMPEDLKIVMLEDETGVIFNRMIDDYFSQDTKQDAAVFFGDIDIGQNGYDWLLKHRPILVIQNIDNYLTYDWQDQFFDFYNFAYLNNMFMIVTSKKIISHYDMQERIYSRLNRGIRIRMDAEDIRKVAEYEIF